MSDRSQLASDEAVAAFNRWYDEIAFVAGQYTPEQLRGVCWLSYAVGVRTHADLLASLSALSARWRETSSALTGSSYSESAYQLAECADDLDALIAAASSGKDVTRVDGERLSERQDLPQRATGE